MRDSEFLFSHVDWFAVDQLQRAHLTAEIDHLDGDRLLNTSVEDLCDYLEKKYRVEVPVLHEDEIVVDQHETQMEMNDYGRRIRVKGTAIEFSVPFDGDKEVFKIRPTAYTVEPPQGEVRDGIVVVRVEGRDLAGDRVRADFDHILSEIQHYLTNLRVNAQDLNNQLRALARGAVERR